jgi:hypothetical protein
MRIAPSILELVQSELDEYRHVVSSADLKPATKQTYIRHADTFVRWLGGNFEPGGTSMADELPLPRVLPFRELFKISKDGCISPLRSMRIATLFMNTTTGFAKGFKVDGKDLHNWHKADALAEVRELGEVLEVIRVFER